MELNLLMNFMAGSVVMALVVHVYQLVSHQRKTKAELDRLEARVRQLGEKIRKNYELIALVKHEVYDSRKIDRWLTSRATIYLYSDKRYCLRITFGEDHIKIVNIPDLEIPFLSGDFYHFTSVNRHTRADTPGEDFSFETVAVCKVGKAFLFVGAIAGAIVRATVGAIAGSEYYYQIIDREEPVNCIWKVSKEFANMDEFDHHYNFPTRMTIKFK